VGEEIWFIERSNISDVRKTWGKGERSRPKDSPIPIVNSAVVSVLSASGQ